jgi:hypothetical protein
MQGFAKDVCLHVVHAGGRRMKLIRLLSYVFVVLGAHVSLAHASPKMIRLGYSDCATCHISPQGGGMLTSYGKGVDEAQSFRRQEVHPLDTATSRFLYDIRFVTASQLVDSLGTSPMASSSTFRLQARSAVKVSDRNRMSYAFGLESPTLTASTGASTTAASLVVSKALWEYRPKDNRRTWASASRTRFR